VAGGLVVTGAVRDQAHVVAASDLQVQQGVHTAHLESRHGDIVVSGSVVGTGAVPCTLRAGGAILCGNVSHAVLEAAGDLVIEGKVHYSTLRAGGNIYLTQALERSLFEVELHVGGSVFLPVAPYQPEAAPPTERRHTRVPVALQAQLALHGPPPLPFLQAAVVDLTPGGARCQFASPVPETLSAGSIVQLKCCLPTGQGEVVVLARVVRPIPPCDVGLAFLDCTEREVRRITRFCQEEARKTQGFRLGTRSDQPTEYRGRY
jgi:hypothetical protein